MIYEHRFETRTKGLVWGQPLLHTPNLVSVPLLRRKALVAGDPVPILWQPVVVSYTVSIHSREGRELLWKRPYASYQDAVTVYSRLIGFARPYLPSVWHEGELEYRFTYNTTFNVTTNDSTKDWSLGGTLAPAGVTGTDYLIVSSGGAGGFNIAGGGGAGGLSTAAGHAVTPGTNYPVVVGTAVAGASSQVAASTLSGNASSFDSVAPDGGGGGGSGPTVNANVNGANGASGGGGDGDAPGTGGTATGVGTGHNASAGSGAASNFGAGAGGGATGVGGTPSGTNGGIGGQGTSSSITGTSVLYCQGGGGGSFGGTAGTYFDTNPSGSNSSSAATNAGANTGNGGGGGGRTGGTGGNGGNSGSGRVALAWNPKYIIFKQDTDLAQVPQQVMY